MERYRTIYLDPPWPERGGGKSKRGADRHYPVMKTCEIPPAVCEALGTYNSDGEMDLTKVADDAHCWMWVTDTYLRHGLTLMERMGFAYKRTLVWAKISPGNIESIAAEAAECILNCFRADYGAQDYKGATAYLDDVLNEKINAPRGGLLRSGLGQYARGSHELLLFGTKGRAHMPPTDARPKSVQFAPVAEHSRKPELFTQIIERCSPAPRIELFARRPRDGWDVWGNEVNHGE